MDRIGYVVTNNFILVGLDTNLIMTIGKGPESVTLTFRDALKVRLLSPTTLISIVGLPNKAGDLYNFVEALQNTHQTFDEVITNINSLYNTDGSATVRQLRQVQDAVSESMDANGVVQQDELMAKFAEDPSLLQLLKEAMQSVSTMNSTATQLFIFAHENGKNLSARYMILGTNSSGHRQDNLPVDHFDYVLCTSMANQDKLADLEGIHHQLLLENLTPGWDQDPEQVNAFKEQARACLQHGLEFSNPFPDMTPNIVYYELSAATGNQFLEPAEDLVTIKIRRP